MGQAMSVRDESGTSQTAMNGFSEGLCDRAAAYRMWRYRALAAGSRKLHNFHGYATWRHNTNIGCITGQNESQNMHN